MTRMPYLFLALVVILGAGLTGYRLSGSEAFAATAAPADAVTRLATLTLPDPAGHPQPVAQWQGQVRVLNFWATWCPPCRKELPGFARLSRKFADKGVQFVGISIDDADKVRAFREETGIPYPLLIGDTDTLALTAPLGNPTLGLPFTIVLDRQGKAALQKTGIVSDAQLEVLLSRLTAAPK